MPIFEYECANCKKVFELLVSGGKPKSVKCPNCDSKKVTRLFSCFSVGSTSDGAKSSKASGACTTCASKNCSSCG